MAGLLRKALFIRRRMYWGGSKADIKNMVLLSDGKPTYNYPLYEPDLYLVDGGPGTYSAWKEKQTGVDMPASAFDYDSLSVGAGNSIWKYYKNEYNRETKEYNYYFYNSGNCAIAEAGYYKAKGEGELYSVALGEGDSELFTEIMEQIASPGKAYRATVDDVKAIFEQIAGRITAVIQPEQVRDVLSDGVRVAGDSSVGMAGAESVVWEPEFVYNEEAGKYVAMITYRVETDDGVLGNIDSEGFVSISKNTVLTYGNGKTAEFATPIVKPVKIYATKYLVGQTCTECEFGVDLINMGETAQTINVKANTTTVIVRRMKEGEYTVEERSTTNNPVGLEYYTVEYDDREIDITQRQTDANIVITNIYQDGIMDGKGGGVGEPMAPDAGGNASELDNIKQKCVDMAIMVAVIVATMISAGALMYLDRKRK